MLAIIYLFVIAASAKEFPIVEDRVYYLQCMLEEKSEPCEITADESFSRNISLLSPQIIREFYKLDEEVVQAIALHNFSCLNTENLLSLPAGIILLMPATHLSKVKQHVMSSLIDQWKTNKIVFKHLTKAVLFSRHLHYLSEKLQNYDFSEENLKWIVEVISLSKLPGTKHIVEKLPLLFFSPPEFILHSHKYEKFYLLSIINKPEDFKSVCSSKCLLRFWAHGMIKNNFPVALENWIDLYTERWGYVLTGATIEELQKLSGNSFDDLSTLFDFNFSPIQVRLLFDNFHSTKILYKKKYSKIPNAVAYLLPHQLIKISNENNFEDLELPSQQSRPTAHQILEIMAAESLQTLKAKNRSHPISKFTYALNLKSFIMLVTQPLSTSDLLQIQSKHLTKSQLYFLSNGGRIFNYSSPNLFKYSELLQMVPARDIMLNQSASHVLFHLLANVNPHNVPQVFALLNKLWPELDSPNVFEKIFSNDNPTIILDYLPSQFVLQSKGLLKSVQGDNLNKLPDMFVSSLVYLFKQSENNFNFFNLNESFSFMYTSLSCDDISSLDPYYFSYIMSQYNNYRTLSGKIFPKKLQNCCINKLLELLNLKSILFQGYRNESKLSLLNEAEIDGIGGYIFSALPVKSIKFTRNVRAILKAIGSLSSYELLSATTLEQLNKLSYILVESLSPVEKISSLLFEMGNLTLFLERKYIEHINENYFKLLLESNYIDQQLCANSETRSAWFSLIKNCFGDPTIWSYQTLKTLGDFLLVVPLSELDKISQEAWIYSADVLKTNYFDTFYLESDKRFYEVCMSHLSNSEKEMYVMDLKKFVTTLVYAAQLQLDTIISREKLHYQKEQSNKSSFFNLFVPNREIKFSFTSIKTVIGNKTISTRNNSSIPNLFTDSSNENTELNILNSSLLSTYPTSYTIGSTDTTVLETVKHSRDNYFDYYTTESTLKNEENESYETSTNYSTDNQSVSLDNVSSLLPNTMFFSSNNFLTPDIRGINSSTDNDYIQLHNYTTEGTIKFVNIDSMKTNYTNEVNDVSSFSSLPPLEMNSTINNFLTSSLQIESSTMIKENMYITESNLYKQSLYSFNTTNDEERSQATLESSNYNPSDPLSTFSLWNDSKMFNYSKGSYTIEHHDDEFDKTAVNITENKNLSISLSNRGIENLSSVSETFKSNSTSVSSYGLNKQTSLPTYEYDQSSGTNHFHLNTETHSVGTTESFPYETKITSNIKIAKKIPELSFGNISVSTANKNVEQTLPGTNIFSTEYSTPHNKKMLKNDKAKGHSSLESTQSIENKSEVFQTEAHTKDFSVSDIIFRNTEIKSSKIQEYTSDIAFSISSLHEVSFVNNSVSNQLKYTPNMYNEFDLKKSSALYIEHFNSHSSPFFPVTSSPKSIFYKNNSSFEVSSFYTSSNETLQNYANFVNSSLPKYSNLPLTESYAPDYIQEQNSFNSKMKDLLNTNSSRIFTQFLESNGKNKKLTDINKAYSLISGKDSQNNNSFRQHLNRVLKKENNLKQSKLKEIKLLPSGKPMQIELSKRKKKRSIQKWSCEALRMVGKPTEIIINENVINNLDDIELMNCIDLFGEMHLPKSIQSAIWKRVSLENIMLAGELLAACNITDILNINFMLNSPWSLETIYLLSKYNSDESVRKHIVNKVWKTTAKPLPVELVVSFGSLVCELPEISTDIISPDTLLKTTAVLSKALPCNFTCLSKLSNIAMQKTAFNDPLKWTSGDVHDLGVIVSGLNISRWNKLVTKNHEALSGLSEAAFDCLPYKYIKEMKNLNHNILPIRISSRLDPGINKVLSEYDFFGLSSHSQVPSLAVSLHVTFIYKNVLLLCIVTIINVFHL